MFSNQFAGVVKTVCAAANVKLAMLVATRFTDYEFLNCLGTTMFEAQQYSEERDQTSA